MDRRPPVLAVSEARESRLPEIPLVLGFHHAIHYTGGGPKMRFYLDTSALIHLQHSPNRDALERFLLMEENFLHVSAINIAEILGYQNRARCKELLLMIKTLSRGNRPVAFPSELLTRSLDFYIHRTATGNISIGSDYEPYWLVLEDPDLIDDDRVFSEMLEWKERHENNHRAWLEGLRQELQGQIQQLSEQDRERVLKHPSTIVRSYCQDETFLEGAIQPFLAAAGHPNTFRGRVTQLLRELEPWRLYFFARAFEVFNRAIQMEGYGQRKNPGSIDLLQATYLQFCDYFVTQDGRQRAEIRRVSFFGHVPRRVITFDRFKSHILNG